MFETRPSKAHYGRAAGELGAWAMSGRLGIDDITPVVSCGRYAAKAVVGEHIPVGATVWREGHDAVAATVTWKGPNDKVARQTRMVEHGIGLDRFVATVVPDAEGAWTFRIDAWSDPWATWRSAVEKKLAAGQGSAELANDLELGARLVERVGRRPDRRNDKDLLLAVAAGLRDGERPLPDRVGAALSEHVDKIMHEYPVRELLTRGKVQKMWVDRPRALYGSWYEFFPRSTGGWDETGKPVHGTFVTATRELDRVAEMGFDVVYLPPIHPIGHVNRKGPNNTLNAGPEDVGSPWAIGSRDGGHDAVAPELGTLADFKGFVHRADELGMEVALDFALQCAPDHPWVQEHPEWFTTLPDGTIAYAENPPKKYQDIYPLNFDNEPRSLYAEVNRVITHWIEQGVRIFRVDNPHTKPPDFWHWLIWEVKRRYPDVLFLAEAFTRPARHVRPGQARLHPVLHLLHLAHRQAGADRLHGRLAGARRRGPAQPVRQHAGHPARVAAARRPGDVRHPGRAGRDDVARPGASTPASSCSSTRRCARAARSTWTPRSTSCGRATSPTALPRAGRWSRGCTPLNAGCAATIPRCSSCARCTSTTSTTTR